MDIQPEDGSCNVCRKEKIFDIPRDVFLKDEVILTEILL
jgi:hypothetical protein